MAFYWYGWWRRSSHDVVVMWCGVVCLAAMAVYISDWALIQNHRALHSLLLLVHIHTHTYTWTHFITSTYTQTFSGVVMLTCMARDVNVTVVSLFHLSCLQHHSRVLKIKQQRKRYNNRQTDRERERLGNKQFATFPHTRGRPAWSSHDA